MIDFFSFFYFLYSILLLFIVCSLFLFIFLILLDSTSSGWMDNTIFYNFLQHIFYPFITDLKIPLLLIDALTTFLSIDAVQFCENNGITLIPVYPKMSRYVEPFNSYCWKALNEFWQEARRDNFQLSERNFCEYLKDFLKIPRW